MTLHMLVRSYIRLATAYITWPIFFVFLLKLQQQINSTIPFWQSQKKDSEMNCKTL